MTRIVLTAALAALLFLTGCSTMWNWSGGARNGTSSSLVDYLYPDGQIPPGVDETVPYLELPLRVGIAFVPGQSAARGALSEATKMRLLEKVKAFEADGVPRDKIARALTAEALGKDSAAFLNYVIDEQHGLTIHGAAFYRDRYVKVDGAWKGRQGAEGDLRTAPEIEVSSFVNVLTEMRYKNK
mgnify:CR=1 FL=1